MCIELVEKRLLTQKFLFPLFVLKLISNKSFFQLHVCVTEMISKVMDKILKNKIIINL